MRQREEVQEMLRSLERRVLMALCAALLSGFFLACSFALPPAWSGMEGGNAAWLALVPLLIALAHVAPRQGTLLGLACGLLFHLIGLAWLLALRITWGNLPLTVLSWIGLALYCSLYVGLFGYLYSSAARILLRKGVYGRVILIFLSPALWVGLEYGRAILFTGFPWNLLGASQYENPVLLQPARIAGVYAVSYLIVLFNTALALTVQRIWREIRSGEKRRRMHYELMIGLLILAISWSMGMRSIRVLTEQAMVDPKGIRIALIQPNTPQVQKWSNEHAREIEAVLAAETDQALTMRPDLVVWPETATPGMVRFDPASRALAADAVAEGASLLVGTMDADLTTRAYFNAALLIGPDEGIHGVYHKRHLVPFGEYMPLASWLPFLERFAPLGFSCTPGDHDQALVVIPGPDDKMLASTLICFEDVFPHLARQDVRRGARILVNLTNDGWFDGTAAPRQHLALAVLRAVENGRPMVRAANSGVSAFIDQVGRVEEVPGPRAEGHRGWGTKGVVIPPAGQSPTLYTRFGDWLLAIPCAVGTLVFWIWCIVNERKNDHA